MGDHLIYWLCLISLFMSVISIYTVLKLSKSLRDANQNIEIIHRALLDFLHPHMSSGGQQYVVYLDEEYYEEYDEANKSQNYSIDDSVIDLFSRQALKWDENLNEWVPKNTNDD